MSSYYIFADLVPSACITDIEYSMVNVLERNVLRILVPKMKVSQSLRDLPGNLGHTKLMFHIYITGCYALRAFCVVFNEENPQRQHCKSNSPKDNVTRPADTLRPC